MESKRTAKRQRQYMCVGVCGEGSSFCPALLSLFLEGIIYTVNKKQHIYSIKMIQIMCVRVELHFIVAPSHAIVDPFASLLGAVKSRGIHLGIYKFAVDWDDLVGPDLRQDALDAPMLYHRLVQSREVLHVQMPPRPSVQVASVRVEPCVVVLH